MTDNRTNADRLRCAWRGLALTALGCLLLLPTLWAAAALSFDVRVPGLRLPLAAGYALALLAAWIFIKRRWLAAGLTAGSFAVVLTMRTASALPSASKPGLPTSSAPKADMPCS